MGNPIIAFRLKKEYRERHERLKTLFGLKGTYSEDRETVIKSQILAEKHLKLKERLKDLFGGYI